MSMGRKSIVFLLLCLALLGLGKFRRLSSSATTALSEEQMSILIGGACKDCRYAGMRLDECYHWGLFDACSTTQCIANYALEDTCDPGIGTCAADQNPNKAWVVQYLRKDTNCTTSNPTGWTIWYNHYYGSSCTKISPSVRCQKNSGSCDGELLESSSRYPGIDCL